MTSTKQGATGPAVAFRDVVKVYHPDIKALDHVSFDIRPGETVALLGPNGAGKSTAIDTMLGLRTPTSGEVRILGSSPAAAVAHGQIGGMLQTGGLPDGYARWQWALVPIMFALGAALFAVGHMAWIACSRSPTAVAGPHRGHRLGLLAKAAMLELLGAHEPQLTQTVTLTAEDNEHGNAISAELGFEVLGRQLSWELETARAPGGAGLAAPGASAAQS